ncbi:MAG TPA: NUDIX domain-containing protein [Candidatus Omnitrophica bacterium]|nr:NUDIX domain-containing protein [Candidatus Omnitrophota bacterium]
MEIDNTKIEVIKQDITEMDVDAIVNPANNELKMGGGVAAAIKKKGGRIIQDEADKLSPIKKGEAVITKAGSLKAKYVIHTATMGMDFKTDQKIIRQATRASLQKTKDKGIRSIAFPALGCGVGRFPADEAARIMLEEVMTYCKKNDNLKKVLFVLYDDKTYNIFKEVVEDRFKKIKRKIENHPIPTVDIIIEKNNQIILIKRENPPFGWALPGGFVEMGETVEEAASREAQEETGLIIRNLKQFHVYSEPGRDPRFHTISCVFTAETDGEPKASSDAKEARFFGKDALPDDIVFDHRKIIDDYFRLKVR